jgi:hypothetical protein
MTQRNPLTQPLDFTLEDASQSMHRFYVSGGALTVFSKSTTVREESVPQILFNIVVNHCFKMRFDRGGDPDHTSWHKDIQDAVHYHHHILKLNDKGEKIPISVRDIECFVLGIKKSEEALGFCADGKTDCLMTDQDVNGVIPSFKTADKSEHASTLDKIDQEIRDRDIPQRMLTGAVKVYVHAFLSTLVDHYLVPYIISRNYDAKRGQALFSRNTISWSVSILKAAVNALVAPSWERAGVQFLIENVIKPALLKIGIFPKETIEKITSIAGTMSLFSIFPYYVALPHTMVANDARQKALMLVRMLGKFKVEDVPVAVVEEQKPVLVVQPEISGELRRRSVVK